MKTIKIYFDYCKLINAKLYLNFEFYPYDDLNPDFDKYKTTVLYVCTFPYALLLNSPRKSWNILNK